MAAQRKSPTAGSFGEVQQIGQDTERVKDGSTHQYSDEQIARARKVWAEAVAWIEDNPSAWCFMRSRFQELGKRGRWFSMQQIVEEVRDKGADVFTPTSGGRFAISHDLRSPLVRMLSHEFPQYAHLLRLKHTAFDAVAMEDR